MKIVQIYKPKVIEFESHEIMQRQVADIIEDRLNLAYLNKGVGRVLLSGGSTPLPVYKKLAHSHTLDWQEIELYQSDERYVKANNPLSNQYNIKECFGDKINNMRAAYFMRTDLDSVDASVEYYNDIIGSLDGVLFDVAVLGIGEDGHLASLFPKQGKYVLDGEEEFVMSTKANTNAGHKVEDRISLSIETILNAEEINVILSGENKHKVLTELLEGEKKAVDFPAKFLLSHPNVNIYCCFNVK
jgi:6-phosphogluconolactonase